MSSKVNRFDRYKKIIRCLVSSEDPYDLDDESVEQIASLMRNKELLRKITLYYESRSWRWTLTYYVIVALVAHIRDCVSTSEYIHDRMVRYASIVKSYNKISPLGDAYKETVRYLDYFIDARLLIGLAIESGSTRVLQWYEDRCYTIPVYDPL